MISMHTEEKLSCVTGGVDFQFYDRCCFGLKIVQISYVACAAQRYDELSNLSLISHDRQLR